MDDQMYEPCRDGDHDDCVERVDADAIADGIAATCACDCHLRNRIGELDARLVSNRADLARVCCQCERPLREHRARWMLCPTGNKQFKGLITDGPLVQGVS